MTKRKHRRSRSPIVKKERVERRVSAERQNKSKKSLGALRKHLKTKPRSPDATGKLCLQRHTLTEISRQLDEIGGDEISLILRLGGTTISVARI
jgi:hypothetical protein